MFKAAGIDYREVDLNGHFVLEGKVNGNWLLFDSNKEPRFLNGRKGLSELIRTGELSVIYKAHLSPELLQKMFAHLLFRQTNAPIAPNGTLFQQITGVLSSILPSFLLFSLFFYLKSKKEKNLYNEKKFNIL